MTQHAVPPGSVVAFLLCSCKRLVRRHVLQRGPWACVRAARLIGVPRSSSEHSTLPRPLPSPVFPDELFEGRSCVIATYDNDPLEDVPQLVGLSAEARARAAQVRSARAGSRRARLGHSRGGGDCV